MLTVSAPPLPDDPVNVNKADPVVLWLIGFFLILQAKHYITDACMNALLKFLCVLFKVLGLTSTRISSIAANFPSSVYKLRHHMDKAQQFDTFVVCSKCHQLYKFEDCLNDSEGDIFSKTCSYIRFPNHPLNRFRLQCGQPLLKKVVFASGKVIFYPLKVYPYKPVSAYLEVLLLRPGFAELCQHWKYRVSSSTKLCDIYDGKIWQNFQVVSDQPFLSGTLGLGFMLNLDWFQPFKHTTYSVGVIYLTIMNLPRSVRFKRENILLIGILPGPSEAKHDVNSYLNELVTELNALWTGVTMNIQNSSGLVDKVTVRCALLCVACDLPAGRKLCGFLGHSAKLGCSKCYKEFSGTVGMMDYSGFDRTKWKPRTNSAHRTSVQKVCKATSKQQQAKIESTEGCRFSCLLKLPYFDPTRMLIIDPMHNAFLGSGKHMLEIWLKHGIITSTHFSLIQNKVDHICTPIDIGRIPYKIMSAFSGFTADQYKNWIITFSIPVLYDILPSPHFECWRSFVLACRIICKRNLALADVNLCDALLMAFCRTVEVLYGTSAITPNMHMHGHIKDIIRDYGPVYAFWLFSYERYNGILGHQPNNNRAIELQLMSRFLRDSIAYTYNFPKEHSLDFNFVCSNDDDCVGSIGDTLAEESADDIKFTMPGKRDVFDDDDKKFIEILYKKLTPNSNNMSVNSVFVKYKSACLKGKKYGNSHGKNPCIALALWNNDVFGLPPTRLPEPTHPNSKFRPVKVRSFIRASVEVDDSVKQLSLAAVSWFKPHPNKDLIGKPAEIWCHSEYEDGGVSSFLPLDHFICRCAFATEYIQNEYVTVIVPLVE